MAVPDIPLGAKLVPINNKRLPVERAVTKCCKCGMYYKHHFVLTYGGGYLWCYRDGTQIAYFVADLVRG